MSMNETAKLLRVDEVADRLRLSRQSVYRKIERHDLPALRLGEGTTSLRISEDELEAWLARNRTGGTS
jgi:excisionase family DNA binding protein